MATVKVFTPNFKHITVKISPNMTLLQVKLRRHGVSIED